MVNYIYKEHFAYELEKFENIKILGNKNCKFCEICVLEDIKDNSIIYISEEKFLEKAINSKASVIILPFNLEEKVLKYLERSLNRAFVLSKNPKLLFSYATSLFKIRVPKYGVDKTAIINSNFDYNNVEIGPYVFIGKDVSVGKNVVIDAFCYIGDNCKIGENTVIFSGVKIYENCEIGKNCIIHANSVIGADGFGYVKNGLDYNKTEHLGRVIIEDDVEIGANSCIDRATVGETRIKKGTKIDNLVQIAHNVEIGQNCAICAQVGIAGGAKIGNNVTLAGQVGVSDHAIIEDNVIVGAQAGVSTKKYAKNHFYLGTPAIEALNFKKSFVLFTQLPDIIKKINELENLIKELQKK